VSTTNSRAIYNTVYTGSICKGVGSLRAEKFAKREEVRYLQNQFETPGQLIETMIEEAVK